MKEFTFRYSKKTEELESENSILRLESDMIDESEKTLQYEIFRVGKIVMRFSSYLEYVVMYFSH